MAEMKLNEYRDAETPSRADILALRGRMPEGLYADEQGNLVARTKWTHPYNYDGFVLWRGEGKANDTIYSDRLLQWDFDKHDRLCEKHFGNRGQYWNKRDPKLIEAFLRDWCECPDLQLTLIMEYCNQASGYPCWRFDFARPSETTEGK